MDLNNLVHWPPRILPTPLSIWSLLLPCLLVKPATHQFIFWRISAKNPWCFSLLYPQCKQVLPLCCSVSLFTGNQFFSFSFEPVLTHFSFCSSCAINDLTNHCVQLAWRNASAALYSPVTITRSCAGSCLQRSAEGKEKSITQGKYKLWSWPCDFSFHFLRGFRKFASLI